MSPAIVRRSDDCLWVRPGEVQVRADVRSAVKDALIDIAHDQGRPFKHVIDDALTAYARENWLREEQLPFRSAA